MIRLQIAQTGNRVGDHVVMFQSRFFERQFPDDNAAFEKVELVDAVQNDREKSLLHMREVMLAKPFGELAESLSFCRARRAVCSLHVLKPRRNIDSTLLRVTTKIATGCWYRHF
jgi:SLOG cluster3 family